MLQERAALLRLPLRIEALRDGARASTQAGHLSVIPVELAVPARAGQLDTANVPGVLASLDRALAGCLAGEFHALVTGPMQKSVVNDAGVTFHGHTEYLCARAGVADVVMLLVADELRVALATTHLALRNVADALTADLLERRLCILHESLGQRFGLSHPRILVAGLNPHAGEGGHLGREEIDVVGPVCNALRERGLDVVGPLPADTLFTPKVLSGADAVMAMYHDQGLPVLKYAGFGRAVNVTLGLPFIRTSVDHGTALDVAGRGGADTGSMSAALALASTLGGSDAGS